MTALKEYRTRRGLSQVQLAVKSDVSTFTIHRAEAGQRLTSLTEEKLADALGVQRVDLFSEADSAG